MNDAFGSVRHLTQTCLRRRSQPARGLRDETDTPRMIFHDCVYVLEARNTKTSLLAVESVQGAVGVGLFSTP